MKDPVRDMFNRLHAAMSIGHFMVPQIGKPFQVLFVFCTSRDAQEKMEPELEENQEDEGEKRNGKIQ